MTANADKDRADRLEACVKSGDALLGAVIEAMGSRPDRDPVLAARELVAERDALKARIEAAPHSRLCQTKWSAFTVEDLDRPCDCWKSDDLIGDQPEPGKPGPGWQERYPEFAALIFDGVALKPNDGPKPDGSGHWCQDPHPEHKGFTYAPVHFHPAARPAGTDEESFS